MAFPDSFTEYTLAQTLDESLGTLADDLGWAVGTSPDPGSYQLVVNKTLLAMGVADIALVSGHNDIQKLLALADVFLWRSVVTQTAGQFAFTADGATYNRQQVNDMAQKRLAQAETQAMEFLPEYTAGVINVNWDEDPYKYRPDLEQLA